MSRHASASFSVGFVLFLATLLGVIGLFSVGGEGIFADTVEYWFVVESANNVREGARVYLDGVVVGQVSSVDLQDRSESAVGRGNVEIRIRVAHRASRWIRGGTVAWLASEGLLGDQVVELRSGAETQPPLEPGSEIPFVPRSLVESLIGAETRANAEALLEELVRLLRSVQQGSGSLGRFMKDDEFYKNATGLVAEAERTLAAVADLLESIREKDLSVAELVLGERDAQYLGEALAAVAEFSKRLREEDGLASALGPEFVDSFQYLASILEKIDRGVGSLGRLVNDPTVADNLSNVFLGIREEPIVRNLIRNAELRGRTVRVGAVAPDDSDERLRAAIAERARAAGNGAIVPAVHSEEKASAGEAENGDPSSDDSRRVDPGGGASPGDPPEDGNSPREDGREGSSP